MNNSRNPYAALKGKSNIAGANINYFRTQKQMSVQQLSDKLIMMGLDIHRQSIFAIESGKRTITDYEICAFAEALGITTNDLLKDFSEFLKQDNK